MCCLCVGKDIQLKLCRRYHYMAWFWRPNWIAQLKKHKFTNARDYQFHIIFHKGTAHVTFSVHRHINFGYVEVSYPFTSVSRTQLKAFWKLLKDFLPTLSFENISCYFCNIFALAKTTGKTGWIKTFLKMCPQTFRIWKIWYFGFTGKK